MPVHHRAVWAAPTQQCPQNVPPGLKKWKNPWCQIVTQHNRQRQIRAMAVSIPRTVGVVIVGSGMGTLSSKRRAARGVAGRRVHQRFPRGLVLPTTVNGHISNSCCRPKTHTLAFRRWLCLSHRHPGSTVSQIQMILLQDHLPFYIVGCLYVLNAVRIMNVSGRNVDREDDEILLIPNRNRATVCDPHM